MFACLYYPLRQIVAFICLHCMSVLLFICLYVTVRASVCGVIHILACHRTCICRVIDILACHCTCICPWCHSYACMPLYVICPSCHCTCSCPSCHLYACMSLYVHLSWCHSDACMPLYVQLSVLSFICLHAIVSASVCVANYMLTCDCTCICLWGVLLAHL